MKNSKRKKKINKIREIVRERAREKEKRNICITAKKKVNFRSGRERERARERENKQRAKESA